jgi:hypothetical protein
MLTVGNHLIAWEGAAWHGMEFGVLSCNGMRFMNRMEYLCKWENLAANCSPEETVYREAQGCSVYIAYDLETYGH